MTDKPQFTSSLHTKFRAAAKVRSGVTAPLRVTASATAGLAES
ncbi:hypothetical protein [Paramylibacter ulvae]|nr:hypothetical protein [Amylibacter ulvae]